MDRVGVVKAGRTPTTRRARRIAAVATIGLTPVLALGWAGCADDEDGSLGGPIYVDPGGTYGAEVTVSIVGRGRVTTSVPGLDCPGNCFAKHIFASATADGAAGGLSLKATPTPGRAFKGWTFSTEPVGTRGRGPASCNPILRAAVDPGVDAKALEIELPYGETAGVVPTGQEGACVDFTKVPVVYNITATFDTDPAIEIDAGPDGSTGGETVYTAPGAIGREVGITQGGYLYWHFTSGSQSGVAYGSNPRGITPQVAQTIVPVGSSISVFEVDAYGVAYQTSAGAIGVIPYGTTSPTAMGGTPPTCSALAVDTSYNVYCRTTSTIVQWLSPSYTTGTVLYTGVPSGSDLHVESASGSLYFSGAGSILSLPIVGADGSPAAPTTIVSSAGGATNLEANGSRFFWLQSGGYVYASSSKSAGTSAYDTEVPPSTLFRHLAEDKNTSSFFWVASSSAIYHAYYFGGTGPGATEPFRTGLSGVTGMTADSSYVYTSHSDGTIRRTSVTGF